MVRKLFQTLVVIFLILLPFLGGMLISTFSPYYEGNSVVRYLIFYVALSMVLLWALFFAHKKHWLNAPLPHVLLFGFGLIMLGIAGLAEPPDLSANMLKHPEREHIRYAILLGGAILFAWYFTGVVKTNSLQLKGKARWLFLTLFLLSIIELSWEFIYHYLYPEALRAWVNSGHPEEAFGSHYDGPASLMFGSTGRFVLYLLIIWLAVRLYKRRELRLWSPILTCVLGTFGVATAVLIFIFFSVGFQPSKQLDFLFIFFIPGVPFLLLYWVGVALLTRKASVSAKSN